MKHKKLKIAGDSLLKKKKCFTLRNAEKSEYTRSFARSVKRMKKKVFFYYPMFSFMLNFVLFSSSLYETN